MMLKARDGAWARAARFATRLAIANVALLAGCGPTEVVVVVDTDIQPMSTDQIQLVVSTAQVSGFQPSTASPAQLPVTLGVTSGHASTFDVDVTLLRGSGTFGQGNDAARICHRVALDVAFTNDEQRVVFVPLFAKCAGTGGTAFPNPLDPDCRDLVSPPTTPLDEDNLPRLPKTPTP
jgi:hypothetical protein